MTLIPVRDLRGQVIDFEWSVASARVACLLGRPGSELAGRRLSSGALAAADSSTMFWMYRKAATSGTKLTFATGCLDPNLDEAIVHEVTPYLSDVSVVLSLPSLIRRRDATELLLRELDDAAWAATAGPGRLSVPVGDMLAEFNGAVASHANCSPWSKPVRR